MNCLDKGKHTSLNNKNKNNKEKQQQHQQHPPAQKNENNKKYERFIFAIPHLFKQYCYKQYVLSKCLVVH